MSARKSLLSPLVALLALAALGAAPAQAATSHPLLGSFGPDGSEASSFSVRSGQLAFDQAGGRLLALVAGGGDRICRFGAFEEGSGEAAPAPFPAAGGTCVEGLDLGGFGNMRESTSLATDNSAGASAGNLYAVDRAGNGTVHGFPPAGGTAPTDELAGFPVAGVLNAFPELETPLGVAVDSAGAVWVADEERVAELGAEGQRTGREVDTSAQGRAKRIAFDSADNLYVAIDEQLTSDDPNLFRYSAAAGYTEATEVDPDNEYTINAIATDTARDRLFVARRGNRITEEQEVGLSGAGEGSFELCFEGECTGAEGSGDLVAPATGTGHISAATGSGQPNLAASGSADRALLATGTGDRSRLARTAGVQRTLLAEGTGDRIEGSSEITDLATASGAFAVGESISGDGIPSGTTIAALDSGAGTLTMSAPATSTGQGGSLVSGSKVLTGVGRASDFSVGESIAGLRIQPGTTITAVNDAAGTLTLSRGVTGSVKAEVESLSRVLSNVTTDTGEFQPGEEIAGPGIPPGTTIEAADAGAGTLTLSDAVTSVGAGGALSSGSRTLTSVATESGSFALGQAIAGAGIPFNTTIEALDAGAGTITLSQGVTSSGSDGAISSHVYLATGSGDRHEGSTEITDLTTASGAFAVGEEIHGHGIPAGTTIEAVDAGAGTLTLSEPASSEGVGIEFVSGSRTLTDVDTETGAFEVGQPVKALNIPAGTTIEAVGPGTLTLSRAVFARSPLDNLFASSAEVTEVSANSGAFTVGQTISAPGIPPGTTIEAVDAGAGTLTLSELPTLGDAAAALEASSAVTGLSVSGGVFFAGEEIAGPGIPAGTRIEALGAGTLALSAPVAAASGAALEAEVPHDAPASLLGKALEALGTIATPAAQVVTVSSPSPGAWKIELRFGQGRDLEELACDPARLGPAGASCEVRTLQDGFEPNRVVEHDLSEPGAPRVGALGGDIVLPTFSGRREFTGIAVDEASRTIYVSDAKNGKIRVFGTTVEEPLATTLAASDRTTASATANGTVNPQGAALSECRFEYVSEAAFQQGGFSDLSSGGSAPCEQALPEDEASHPVSASLEGLAPATRYRYRLLATGPGGTGAGLALGLATLGPLLSATRASAVKYTTAGLGASVNPQGKATSYRFEYVPAATCQADLEAEGPGHCFDRAASTPQSAPLGPDEAEHPAAAALAGLAEGTAYRFRAVAANSDATGLGQTAAFATHARPAPPDPSCPNAAERTGPSAALGECRAYEQVSPLEKGSADAAEVKAQAAASGEALVFAAQQSQAFPGSPGSAAHNHYLARRGAGGAWSTESLTTALAPKSFNAVKFSYLGFSEDLARGALCTGASLGVPGDGDGLYLRDNLSGAYREVPGTDTDVGEATCLGGATELIADPGFSRVVFSANEPLSPDAPALEFGQRALYEWSGGALSLLSRDPGGAPIAGNVFSYRDHAVSADGERVFWGGAGAGGKGTVYARVGGAQTVDLGLSERSPQDPAGPRRKTFVEASADGEAAFFISGEKLTDDSTAGEQPVSFEPSRTKLQLSGELYRYDSTAPEGERLTDLTVAPGEPDGAEVQGVIDASADGNRIYFVALGALAPGASSGQPNLYLWDGGGPEPALTHVATLAPSSEADKSNISPIHNHATPMATPDGARLVFLSAARLSAYDNANRAMAYLYDAGEDRLTCLSCDPSGEAASAAAALGEGSAEGPTSNLRGHQRRNLSADGARAFFETADSLLPADTNGKVDVYEWSEGELALISTGAGDEGARFVDASRSGDDVFIATRQKLSPLDEDSLVDVYDARVGGIPARPRPPRSECLGEACQAAAVAPDEPTPASVGLRGAGNLRAGRDCGAPARRARRLARRARRTRKRAARSRGAQQGRRMRRRAKRLGKRAKRLSRQTERCRRANRGRAGR